MERSQRSVAGLLVLPLVAAIVGSAGCTGVCNCPSGIETVALPATWPSSVTTISASPPCTIVSQGAVGDMIAIGVTNSGSDNCLLTVQLANGDVYSSRVSVAARSGCCSSESYVVDAGPFELVDAGSMSPG